MKINQNLVANLISRLFGPPVIMFFFILWPWWYLDGYRLRFHHLSPSVLIWLLLVNWLLPVLVFTYLYKKGKISHLDAPNREERVPVYGLIFLLWTFNIMFLRVHGDLSYYQLFLPFYLLTASLALITFFYKISIHAAYSVFLWLWLLHFYAWPVLLAAPLPVLVAWSRYYKHNHTLLQLGAGGLVALSIFLISAIFII